MNHDKDADPDEVPDPIDRLLGRPSRVRSLPGPRPESFPPALEAPSPRLEPPTDRSPAAEISLSLKHVYITVELPDAPKDALDIRATERSLAVRAPRVGSPACEVEIELPVPVDPGSAKATYRNCILDVTLTRIQQSGGERNEV